MCGAWRLPVRQVIGGPHPVEAPVFWQLRKVTAQPRGHGSFRQDFDEFGVDADAFSFGQEHDQAYRDLGFRLVDVPADPLPAAWH